MCVMRKLNDMLGIEYEGGYNLHLALQEIEDRWRVVDLKGLW